MGTYRRTKDNLRGAVVAYTLVRLLTDIARCSAVPHDLLSRYLSSIATLDTWACLINLRAPRCDHASTLALSRRPEVTCSEERRRRRRVKRLRKVCQVFRGVQASAVAKPVSLASCLPPPPTCVIYVGIFFGVSLRFLESGDDCD